MPETTDSAIATIDRLIADVKTEIDSAMNAQGGDRNRLLLLGREADGYMALREILTGTRVPAAAN